MKFIKDVNPTGACLQGHVVANYARLVEVFGSPTEGPNANIDDKVTCEWCFQFEDGTLATIYDWKEWNTPMGEHRWHIGGESFAAVERIYEELELEIRYV
jgi:hypothetical protein